MSENILDETYIEKREANYARLWKRIFASLIDGLIFAAITLALRYFVFVEYTYIVSAISILIYKPCMEYFFGATLGKMALKIKVLSLDQTLPSITQIILRNIFRIIDEFAKMLFFSATINMKDLFNWESRLPFTTPIPITTAISLLVYLVDVLVLVFNSKNQALHDIIGNTIVVQSEP